MVINKLEKTILVTSNLKIYAYAHALSISSTSLIMCRQVMRGIKEKTSQFGKIGGVFMPPVFMSYLGGGRHRSLKQTDM